MFDPDDETPVPFFTRASLDAMRDQVDHDRVKRVVARSIERASTEEDDDDVDQDWLAFEDGARPLGVVIDDSERGPDLHTPTLVPAQRQARPESATTLTTTTNDTHHTHRDGEPAATSTPAPPLPEIVAAQLELIEWQQQVLESRKRDLIRRSRSDHPPTAVLVEPTLRMRLRVGGIGTLIRNWLSRWLPGTTRKHFRVSP